MARDIYQEYQERVCFHWLCRRCLAQSLPLAACSVLRSDSSSSCDGYDGYDGESALSGTLSTDNLDLLNCKDMPSVCRMLFTSSSSLNISVLNVRSLLRVSAEIAGLLVDKQIDILLLCETWLDSTVRDSEVCPPGFSILRCDRNRQGGGVAIIVSSRVRFLPRPDLSFNNLESLWVDIFPGSKRSMLICCTYRPPSSSSVYFDNLMDEFDKALSKSTQRVALIGDLNCDLSRLTYLKSSCWSISLITMISPKLLTLRLA